MAYSFDQVFAADPANPANIAQNAAITIYAPGDPTMTPLTLTDPSGGALANPIQVNANGFGPAFQHDTLDRVAWSGGGFTGFFTSYEGMKDEAVAARTAAETAAATAGADAAAVADAAIGNATAEAEAARIAAEAAAANAGASATAASNAAALVGAPADTAIAAAINGTGATKTALNAAFATKAELSTAGGGDKSHNITDPALAKAPRATLQTIPTYDGSGIAVHPSVYFNPDGWKGWKYWMAFTPYANSNTDLENPSIVVSQDGNTWQVPAGLTNPIEPDRTSGYNSDPYLTVANDGTMYCFWRAFDGSEFIYYRTSADGITWSARQTSRTANPATDRLVSPSVIQQPDGTWVMYAVDIVPNPRRIVRTTAATPAGPWAALQTCTITGNTGNPWHLDAHKVGGEWHLMVMDGGSGGGDLWAAVSSDGLTFKAGPAFIAKTSGAWDGSYYKSCFIPAVNGGLAGWDAWIGGASFVASGNIVGRTFVRFDQLGADIAATNAQLALARGETAVLQSLNGLPPWIIGDSFARADNATSLGNATTGQAWTAASGSWKIANKAAQPQAAANNIALIETGVTDHWVNVTYDYADATGTRALITRYADASNFYRFGVLGGVLQLQKVVAGAATAVGGAVNGTIASGMTLGVRCVGSTIELYVNNVLAATRTDTSLTTGTKVGIQDNSATGRYRMFTARTS